MEGVRDDEVCSELASVEVIGICYRVFHSLINPDEVLLILLKVSHSLQKWSPKD